MSYDQRVATYEQFVNILKNGAENKVRYAPSADQISGLMEGVVVSLHLEEMSVDYAEIISKNPRDFYIPRCRVHATVLFDYSTYVVDVMEDDWFKLPPLGQWQRSLPAIIIPDDVFEAITRDDPEDDGEAGVREPRPQPDGDDDHKAKVTAAARHVGEVSAGLNDKLADGDASVSLPEETPVR